MTSTKAWLGRARHIDREINALERARDEANAKALRITASYTRTDGVQTTKDPHKLDNLVVLEDLLDRRIEELHAVKVEITEAIMEIDDERQRTVLLDYYVRCLTLEQTAVETNYSFPNVRKLRAKGIACLEQKFPGKFVLEEKSITK